MYRAQQRQALSSWCGCLPAKLSSLAENAMLTRQGPFDMVLSLLDRGLQHAADIGFSIQHDFHADGKGRVWAGG